MRSVCPARSSYAHASPAGTSTATTASDGSRAMLKKIPFRKREAAAIFRTVRANHVIRARRTYAFQSQLHGPWSIHAAGRQRMRTRVENDQRVHLRKQFHKAARLGIPLFIAHRAIIVYHYLAEEIHVRHQVTAPQSILR